MEIVNTVRHALGIFSDEEFVCAEEGAFVEPDDFNNLSEFDSLLVDSKEGAPE